MTAKERYERIEANLDRVSEAQSRTDEKIAALMNGLNESRERFEKDLAEQKRKTDKLIVIIERLDQRDLKYQEIHNELLRLTNQNKLNIDALYQSQINSNARLDRIETNLDRLIEGLRTGGRNGRE